MAKTSLAASAALPPEGWAPCPLGSPGERWWDGAGWTTHVRPERDVESQARWLDEGTVAAPMSTESDGNTDSPSAEVGIPPLGNDGEAEDFPLFPFMSAADGFKARALPPVPPSEASQPEISGPPGTLSLGVAVNGPPAASGPSVGRPRRQATYPQLVLAVLPLVLPLLAAILMVVLPDGNPARPLLPAFPLALTLLVVATFALARKDLAALRQQEHTLEPVTVVGAILGPFGYLANRASHLRPDVLKIDVATVAVSGLLTVVSLAGTLGVIDALTTKTVTINSVTLQNDLTQQIQEQNPDLLVRVTCPGGLTLLPPITVTCSALKNGTPPSGAVPVAVSIKDRAGRFTWRLGE